MRFEQIRCEEDRHVLTITLNRPQRLNAWTERMGQEIAAAFDRADADDDVRAVIVTGEGRASCAGMDLDAGPETFDATGLGPGQVRRDAGGVQSLRVFASTKPGHRSRQRSGRRRRSDDDAPHGHPPRVR